VGDIIETGINWDHETGEVVVSTRRKGIALRLKRAGFEPLRDEGPAGYVTFKAHESELRVSLNRRRKASEAQREAARRALESARKG
jgi:hypothetical protein